MQAVQSMLLPQEGSLSIHTSLPATGDGSTAVMAVVRLLAEIRTRWGETPDPSGVLWVLGHSGLWSQGLCLECLAHLSRSEARPFCWMRFPASKMTQHFPSRPDRQRN